METYASGHAFSPSPQPLSVSTFHDHASPSTAAAEQAYMENDGKMIFEELLDAEVAINMPKLREASRLGIPATLRSTIYRYLLGIAFMDKSSELTIERMQEKDFDALVAAYKETWLGQGRSRDGAGGGNGNTGGSNNDGNTGSGSHHPRHSRNTVGVDGSSTGSGAGRHGHSPSVGTNGHTNSSPGGNGAGNTSSNGNEENGDEKDTDAESGQARARAEWLRHRVELAMEGLCTASQAGTCATTSVGLYDSTPLLLRAAPVSELEGYGYWARAWSRIRHQPPYCDDFARRQQLELTLGALQVTHHTASAEHVEVLVALSVSLERVHATTSTANARDVFFYVETIYFILTHYGNILQDEQSLQTHCGTFQMLFHSLNPTLYDHFVREGITTLEWVPGLLMALLAGRLPETNLLRLWDCYFADAWIQLGFPLHPYVCLAILASLTEDLLECSKMSILYRLRHLPAIDTSVLLHRAVSMRESVYEHGLL